MDYIYSVFHLITYLLHDCGATGQLRRDRNTSATRGIDPWTLLICGADVRLRLQPRRLLLAPHKCDVPCSVWHMWLLLTQSLSILNRNSIIHGFLNIRKKWRRLLAPTWDYYWLHKTLIQSTSIDMFMTLVLRMRLIKWVYNRFLKYSLYLKCIIRCKTHPFYTYRYHNLHYIIIFTINLWNVVIIYDDINNMKNSSVIELN